jgi:hypothetical protein
LPSGGSDDLILATPIEWVQLVVTVGLGLVTAFIGFTVSRLKARQEVAVNVSEKLFTAYQKLWATMEVASTAHGMLGERPLTSEQLKDLFKSMRAWYYEDGNGMLLVDPIRAIYLTATYNLICPDSDVVPASLAEKLRNPDVARGDIAVQQLALLRTALLHDIGIYARGPKFRPLGEGDDEFLRWCGADPTREPWSESRRLRRRGVSG